MKGERRAIAEEGQELQQLLGPLPGWGLRWGITAVFLFAAIFLLLAWLVKYPDVIEARVVILAEAPPVRLAARQDGQLSHLLVADQQAVQAGQLLAVLENPAVLADVDTLAKWLAAINQHGLPEALSGLLLPAGLQLGSLQHTYAALAQQLDDYRYFRQQTGTAQRAASLETQLDYQRQLQGSLQKQRQMLSQETELAQRDYQRDQDLLKTGGASQADVEASQTAYLHYLRQGEALQAELLHNKLQEEALQTRLIELRQSRAEQEIEKELAARRLLVQLQAELDAWRQLYLFIAPFSGQVSMSQPWSERQYIRTNELLLAIVPGKGSGPLLAKGILPAAGAGKARPGMAAHLFLDAYPHQEYGIIKGELRRIALLPEQGSYQIEIALPDSLVTAYGRGIPFAPELGARAEIITEERRVLERVLQEVFSLLKPSK